MWVPRTWAALPVAAGLATAGCAVTEPVSRPERVCALPEVTRTVVLELQKRGVSGEIDARNPGEVTDPDGSAASCSVWLIQPHYDTNLPGPQPRYTVVAQMYRVRRLPHSLAVDLADQNGFAPTAPGQ